MKTREREARIAKALARLPEWAEIKRRQGRKTEEARASSADADATVMKRGDGRFRPAYNAQYATDGVSQVVVAGVVTVGSDQAQRVPMIEQVAECVNAWARNRGLKQLLVRGKAKVRCVVLLHALAHNLMRMAALAPRLIGIGTIPPSAAGLVAATG